MPNKLTILRIIAVPALVAAHYFYNSTLPAVVLFILASVTDWLDGYAARATNQVTALGAFLDPVADKLLVVTVLGLLMSTKASIYLTIAGIIIIAREVFISSLREWMAIVSSNSRIEVSIVAKFKTALQMFALTLLLYASKHNTIIWDIGLAVLILSVTFSIYSAQSYVKTAWPALTFGSKQQ
ncbi:MAG: CDP-diacylglycerol--glycerol-3-phosphate 3-phosphatidyltransferase [Pseudomonadota bacterium]|nr:CDP-diacylglycerol--glycerol-3-phosphate 3-phosphatidyltransferase [Pseudomonadota bacterium]